MLALANTLLLLEALGRALLNIVIVLNRRIDLLALALGATLSSSLLWATTLATSSGLRSSSRSTSASVGLAILRRASFADLGELLPVRGVLVHARERRG